MDEVAWLRKKVSNLEHRVEDLVDAGEDLVVILSEQHRSQTELEDSREEMRELVDPDSYCEACHAQKSSGECPDEAGHLAPTSPAHRHQKSYVGECCRDERLRQTEQPAAEDTAPGRTEMDFVEHVKRQQAFSFRTFGPPGVGQGPLGVVRHLRKECDELEEQPADLEEWVDAILLSTDGAIKAGYSPEQIAAALAAKLAKNEARQWPRWQDSRPDDAIEHVRTPEELAEKAARRPGACCPKCGAVSGDDWSQCRGSCPMKGSPHSK